jgi:hypothetical protein
MPKLRNGGTPMAKKAKTTKASAKSKSNGRVKRRSWSDTDLRELKKHSRSKTPVASISKAMKRTMGALRQQALKLGLPLGHRR